MRESFDVIVKDVAIRLRMKITPPCRAAIRNAEQRLTLKRLRRVSGSHSPSSESMSAICRYSVFPAAPARALAAWIAFLTSDSHARALPASVSSSQCANTESDGRKTIPKFGMFLSFASRAAACFFTDMGVTTLDAAHSVLNLSSSSASLKSSN